MIRDMCLLGHGVPVGFAHDMHVMVMPGVSCVPCGWPRSREQDAEFAAGVDHDATGSAPRRISSGAQLGFLALGTLALKGRVTRAKLCIWITFWIQ